MAADKLILGTFIFAIDDLPENIPLGGEQMLAVTKYPGGYKDVQSFGVFDDVITLTGTFNYTNAKTKVNTLDKMWKSGNIYTFKIGSFKTLRVLISKFKYTYQSLSAIGYSLELEVVPSGSSSASGSTSSSSTTTGTTTSKPKSDSPAPQRVYVVKKGDCLWNIAKHYYHDGREYKKIMTANKLKSTIIQPGQKLVIP